MELNIANVYNTAVSEMNAGQYEEAEKHFDMVALQDPANWQAMFFRSYCKCHHGKVGDIPRQAQDFQGAFTHALNSVLALPAEEQEAGVRLLLQHLYSQADYFIANGKNVGGFFTGSSSVSYNTIQAGNDLIKNCVQLVEAKVRLTPELQALVDKNKELMKAGSASAGWKIILGVIGVILFIVWLAI